MCAKNHHGRCKTSSLCILQCGGHHRAWWNETVIVESSRAGSVDWLNLQISTATNGLRNMIRLTRTCWPPLARLLYMDVPVGRSLFTNTFANIRACGHRITQASVNRFLDAELVSRLIHFGRNWTIRHHASVRASQSRLRGARLIAAELCFATEAEF